MSGREAMCRFVFWRIASYSPELPNTYFARDAMNDTINIWKSNLQASWRKLSARSIFFGASATSNEQIPMTTFYVSVAAFNNEGQVCELRIPQPFGPALLAGGRVRGESAVLDEVKKRFTDLNARSVIDRLAGAAGRIGLIKQFRNGCWITKQESRFFALPDLRELASCLAPI